MNPEGATRQRILDLNTSAADRVYMLKLPQGLGTWPAVRVQLIDDPEDYHLRGGSKSGRVRVQVDCYAPETPSGDPYSEVSSLADEINGDDAGSGLSGWIGSLGSPAINITGMFRIDRQPMYEPGSEFRGVDLRLVRMRMDYWVHYRMQ